MREKNKGFTLLELVIVIAIIGILVALLAPAYVGYVRRARLSKNKANAKEAATAAEVAYATYAEEKENLKANKQSVDHGYSTVTYTYFADAEDGILNFKYRDNDRRWIVDGAGSYHYYEDTDLSNWTVNTAVSDGIKLGDRVALIWTIHMDPDTGAILGYYCAFPKSSDPAYQEVVQAIKKGNASKYQ